MSQENTPPAALPPPSAPQPFLNDRSRKQLGLFFAGAAFMIGSTIITRRAIVRRTVAAYPKFHEPNLPNTRPALRTPSQQPHAPAAAEPSSAAPPLDGASEGPFIAAEALGLATLHVLSFAIMATGGIAYAFDISSVEDLRTYARKSIYGAAQGVKDEDAEKELEAWVAKILARKSNDEDKGKKE